MFFRYRFRDIAVLPLATAGVSLLLSGAAIAQSQSSTPTNLNGVSLRLFGDEAASSAAAPVVAADPSQDVVLPPIPREIRGRDTRSWWQRRKDDTAEAARVKGEAMAEAEAAASGPQNVIQPSRAGIRAETAAAHNEGRASAEVVPTAPAAPSEYAAPGPPTGPAPVASYDGGNEVPVTNDGQSLKAFGSEQQAPSASAAPDVETPSFGAIPGVEPAPSPSPLKRLLPWNWFK